MRFNVQEYSSSRFRVIGKSYVDCPADRYRTYFSSRVRLVRAKRPKFTSTTAKRYAVSTRPITSEPRASVSMSRFRKPSLRKWWREVNGQGPPAEPLFFRGAICRWKTRTRPKSEQKNGSVCRRPSEAVTVPCKPCTARVCESYRSEKIGWKSIDRFKISVFTERNVGVTHNFDVFHNGHSTTTLGIPGCKRRRHDRGVSFAIDTRKPAIANLGVIKEGKRNFTRA